MVNVIIILTLLLLLLFSWKIMKNISIDDFYANSKSTESFPLFLSLLASLIGGWMFLGLTQMSYDAGLISLYIGIGYAIGFSLLYKAIPKIKSLLNKHNAYTLDECLLKFYGLKIGIFITIINFIFFIAILSAQFVVLKQILMPFNDIINVELLFWVFAISVLIYTVISGYKGILITDKYQLFFIVLLMGLLLMSLGEYQVINQIQNLDSNYIFGTKYGIGFIVAVLVFFPLTVLVRTDVWQRIASAKDIKISKKAILITIPFLIIAYIVMTYIGMSINTMNIEQSKGVLPLISLIEHLLNAQGSSYIFNIMLLATLFGIGAALMSTIDSNLNVVVTAISRIKEIKNKKEELFFARTLSVVIGILGVISSIFINDIVNVIVGAGAIILIMFPVVYNFINSKHDRATETERKNAFWTLILGYSSFAIFVYVLNPKSAFLPGFLVAFIFWHTYKYFTKNKILIK